MADKDKGTDKNSSPKKRESKGLCDNCINLKNCSYAKIADRPVMFCEEYDFYSRLVEKYGIDLNGKKKKEDNKDQKKGSPD